ncbi:T9SS type B sorting domain-containing protein [Chryseobacterium defluvii]|uniref:Gliding motility-associated-like protein n=1 Tax=Chryseobacterium defluvii TaxID=160396 RepID=A0A495S914_9FLAO|nr:gliding motility-associated C-terminal domain-containing protein [Chryseobacterium defluvii]RKS96302.1 gliding motility-associated-like protein [Chryseobacterium defluvii]
MKKILLFFLLLSSQIFFSQSDCPTAIAVCGNANISYTPSGPGNILEDLGGCLIDDENFSVWYTFTVATSGTLAFTIDANVDNDDYDFGVYGPNKQCSNLGAPIRCNFAGVSPTGNTGLSLTPPPNAYWSPHLNVVAGETYYLIIDNYSNSANGFSLIWSGTATLASPFNDPAITPNPFIAPGIPAANPADPPEVIVCSNPAIFDFSTLSAGIINGNPNFSVKYHTSQNDALTGNNPITAPIVVTVGSTYYYSINYTNPANPNDPVNRCKQTGSFKFKDGTIEAYNDTLTECNNNNAGTATYDLTTADVIDPTLTVTKKYYPTIHDVNAGTNEITNPYSYVSAEGTVYVKITSQYGCTDIAEISLKFHPVVIVNEATLRSCFIETNPSTALFNLTVATVTSQGGTKTYYPSLTDAVNGTNQISNPSNYIAPSGVVYIKVTNANGCYAIAKVTLIVLPPVYSSVLADKIICMEDTTTLDAGPGFASYLWSNGATTQTVSGIGVGTYWVKLKTGDCITTQTVKVYPAEQPVVSSIDIATNTVTVNVVGGMAPYKYSMDNVNWQDSNVFTNVPRGDNTVYVKDAYDCEPIDVEIIVPNLINVITPNGDGVNDIIDYSALANKQNLTLSIYDRYGSKIYQADKSNGYKWDGTTNGSKRVTTGTYWYSVTWNENDKHNTPFKFSSWIMVKNRE